MSKLANPWKCDACGILRANDTNHWLIVRRLDTCLRCDLHGTSAEHDLHLAQPMAGVLGSEVIISKWSDNLAAVDSAKHACGVPCGLKLAAQLVMEAFFPAEISSTGKEVADGQSS